MYRRALLRLLATAPVAMPALLKLAHDRPSLLWMRFKPDRLYKMVQNINGQTTISLEGVKRIGPQLERYHRVVYEKTMLGRDRLIEEVTWLVRRGETIEGTTHYIKSGV